MIIEEDGSMFQNNHGTLVCPVNMIGTMGKGLALYFKNRYHGLFRFYRTHCDQGSFRDFSSVLFRGQQNVILFPSKIHWANDSKVQWINEGLQKLRELCEREGIMEIGLPPVGCGNGNLEFKDVRFLVYHHFENSPVRVHLYSP